MEKSFMYFRKFEIFLYENLKFLSYKIYIFSKSRKILFQVKY